MPRIMGVDYGRKRVGLAISDEDEVFAFPHEVLNVRDLPDAVRQVIAHCRSAGAARVVAGMPINMNGSRGPMAEEVTRFVAELVKHGGMPVETWDERLTTSSVEQVLIAADMSRQRRKEVRDKLAAQQILQGYLDAHAGAGPTP